MLVSKAVQLLLALAMVANPGDAATTSAIKLCGRKLSDIMSRVCHAYNSPSWDDPTVEQPGAIVRRKRQIGIADQCCTFGCTWEQLSEYCAISANPLEDIGSHIVAEHTGSERKREAVPAPAPVMSADTELSREVGRSRRRGYGRGRGRRCWCRRKRRSGRRRASVMGLMGNMDQKNARPAAVVGTVSPLLIWGSTLNTDLPPDNNRYNYIAVYS